MSSSIQATSNSLSTVSGQVDVQSKGTFTVTGSTVGTTETSITIPSGTKAFRLQAANDAGAAVLTISHSSGGTSSSTTSFDIYAGASLLEEQLKGDVSLTVYIKSSKASTSVQVLLWS